MKMDISEKLFQIKKLLELQTFQKNGARDNLINLLRDLYFAYMFYKVEETNKTTKCKREQQSLLRLLLVHVDSENHTSNGEKILMINLIKIIEKKVDLLFSYYPNIWKSNNSFLFFYICTEYDNKKMIQNAFSILKDSNNVYLNIYISLLLFRSNSFKIKIKTIKHIFEKYVLNFENTSLSDNAPINFEEFSITDFLKKAKSFKEIAENIIGCFFFSIIDSLIKNDYFTLLNENMKKEDEDILRQLSCRENKCYKNGSKKTKNEYLETMINYAVKKKIFNRYFNLNQSDILLKKLNKSKFCSGRTNSDNGDEVEEEKEKEEIDIDSDEEEEGEEGEEEKEDEKKKQILRKDNLYYDNKKDEIIFNEIKDHYNKQFLKCLFLYVKNIIKNYELLYINSKKSVTQIKNNYLACCLIQCISILFNICCFDQMLVQDSVSLIYEMKEKFINYFDCSIIFPLAHFVLFFSLDTDFEQVANFMFLYISEEYKNCLVSISFFDFLIKNANILKKRDFFFPKFFYIILKIYFYYYRILKNALIYLFPYLMNEENYGILLCQLLDVPYSHETTNIDLNKTGIVTICNGSKSCILLVDEEASGEFSNNTIYQQLKTEIKNKNRLDDIRNNMQRYVELYFNILLKNEEVEEKKQDTWLIEVTKIVLHKLNCITSYETTSKKIVKEVLIGFKNMVNKKRDLLLLFQLDIINLIKKNSQVSILVNRKILYIIGKNIKYLKIPLKHIEKYYSTITSLFTFSKYYNLKFWSTLLYTLTNIAISCYDLSAKILQKYKSLLSENDVPLILKNLTLENISIIKNFSYINDL